MHSNPLRRLAVSLALVGPLALSAVACSSSDSEGASKDTTSTTVATTTSESVPEGDVVTASGPIDLAVGETATIRLAANPTTGYQWEPAGAPDDAVIRVVSDHYEAEATEVVGSGGTQEIVIEGTGAGTTTLELRYVRPWEEGGTPAETATFEITVS